MVVNIGGLVARGALPYLQEYKDLFKSYISISTPHLGTAEAEENLLNKGLSFMSGKSKMLSVREMNLDDNIDLYSCYLFKLSKDPGLSWFKNLILFSSSNDKFCPLESAQIQVNSMKK